VGSIPQRAASVRGKLSRCSKAQVSGLEGIFAIYKSGLAKTLAFLAYRRSNSEIMRANYSICNSY
jgi:hypothetical protein